MIDIVDTKTRSRMMASIQGKDTRPEMLVRPFCIHGDSDFGCMIKNYRAWGADRSYCSARSRISRSAGRVARDAPLVPGERVQ